MIDNVAWSRAFHLLGNILDYPTLGLTEEVRECIALLEDVCPRAVDQMSMFQAFLEDSSAHRMEEIFSRIFDLNAVCHPYVGYHLFGESYKRSAFLLELKERFRAHGYEPAGTELPDHLAILLRFVGMSNDSELNEVIIKEGMLPTLRKMTKDTEKTEAKPEDDPETKRIKLWDMFSEPQFNDGATPPDDLPEEGAELQMEVNAYKHVLLSLRTLLEQPVPKNVEQTVGGSIGGSVNA